jgi:hypothetical protein
MVQVKYGPPFYHEDSHRYISKVDPRAFRMGIGATSRGKHSLSFEEFIYSISDISSKTSETDL